MVIRELINKSYYGTIGYISSQEDIDLLGRYILYNGNVLKEFINIIVATNFKDKSLIPSYEELWKSYQPKVILLHSETNRGHNHGNTDLDNLIVDYCKNNNIEWLCKSANDVIIQESILNTEIQEADFYYMNGIGYGGLQKYNFNFDRIINEDFYPQTNFYFINVSKVDYLNDKEYLDKTYDYIKTIPNYNGRIWEYIQDWSCENFLKQCVFRNKLSKFHLIKNNTYISLLNYVKNHNIHDCSHKNVLINGVCHLAYPDQNVIEI